MIGATTVFPEVAEPPLSVSFVVTFKITCEPLEGTTVVGPSFTALIGLATTILAVAVLQLAGTTLIPVAGSASHNS